MHVFFDVLQGGLRAVRWTEEDATVRFVVGVLRPDTFTLRLSADSGRLFQGEGIYEPDLRVYCDEAQLDALVQHGFSPRPLRFEGTRALFDTLSERIKPGLSLLALRSGGAS